MSDFLRQGYLGRLKVSLLFLLVNLSVVYALSHESYILSLLSCNALYAKQVVTLLV